MILLTLALFVSPDIFLVAHRVNVTAQPNKLCPFLHETTLDMSLVAAVLEERNAVGAILCEFDVQSSKLHERHSSQRVSCSWNAVLVTSYRHITVHMDLRPEVYEVLRHHYPLCNCIHDPRMQWKVNHH